MGRMRRWQYSRGPLSTVRASARDERAAAMTTRELLRAKIEGACRQWYGTPCNNVANRAFDGLVDAVLMAVEPVVGERQKYVDAHASVKGGLVEVKKQLAAARDTIKKLVAQNETRLLRKLSDTERLTNLAAALKACDRCDRGEAQFCDECMKADSAKSRAECERLKQTIRRCCQCRFENSKQVETCDFHGRGSATEQRDKWKARAEALQGLVDSIGPRCKKCGRLNWRVSTTARHAREAEPRGADGVCPMCYGSECEGQCQMSAEKLYGNEAEPTTEGGSDDER